MARWRSIASVAVLTSLVLAGCTGSPGGTLPNAEEGAGAGSERVDNSGFAAETACLTSGSPWSLDIEAMLTDYVTSVNATYPADGQAVSWLASGTATMSFVEGEPQLWLFRAKNIVFDIATVSPLAVVSNQSEEQTAEFAVVEGGFIMLQFPASSSHEISNLYTLPDGSSSEVFAAWPPPVFAWSLDIALGASTHTMGFTCTEDSLVIDGLAFTDYQFVPGR